MRFVSVSLLISLTAGPMFGAPSILGPASTVDDVLDALHDSGKNFKTLAATVKTDEFDATQGSDIYRHGRLVIKRKPDGSAQFHLVYTDRQFGDKKPVVEKQEYLLDDGWGTKRDFTAKNEHRQQISRPGENLELFRLGAGSIPMPIGQDRSEVEAQFIATIAAGDKDDPTGSIHLVLTPRRGGRYFDQYKTVDIWVDMKLKMPVRITTTRPNNSSSTHDLSDMKINIEIPNDEFKLPPLQPGWQSTEELLSK